MFVRDTVTGSTQLVSVSSSGGAADKPSGAPKITPDGRYVVFYSYASNLVPGVANNVSHIFVRDLQAGTTRVADTAADGTLADAEAGSPTISADGRYVAFESNADNLIPGRAGTGHVQVFVKDMQTGAVTLASANMNGGFGDGDSIQPDITPDGRYVAFASKAADLTADRDTNSNYDVFLRDLQLGTTVRGRRPAVRKGRRGSVRAFGQRRRPLRVVHVDRAEPRGLAGVDQLEPRTSSCVMWSAGTTVQASVASDGTSPNGPSLLSHISADGTSVVFTSIASNLTAGDRRQLARHLRAGPRAGRDDEGELDGHRRAARSPRAYVSSASPDNRYVAWIDEHARDRPRARRGLQLYERDMGSTRRRSDAADQCRSQWRERHGQQQPSSGQSGTVGTSCTRRRRRTWSPATPTSSGTCSAETW